MLLDASDKNHKQAALLVVCGNGVSRQFLEGANTFKSTLVDPLILMEKQYMQVVIHKLI